ncbi:hypothetical protein NT05LI_0155 [Listeria ivanovii FSL F6-596]|nr:hypothetical protein NT05LI_0155 [Listeria ivanovii FSL F6-596]
MGGFLLLLLIIAITYLIGFFSRGHDLTGKESLNRGQNDI